MSAEISPLWLRAEDTQDGDRRFFLPWLWRARLAAADGVFAVELARDTAQGIEPLELRFLSLDGRPLGHGTIAAPVAALALPRGTTTLVAARGAGLRLGLYPRGKLWLKLHAFAHGRFPGLPPHRRWRAAGAAARDLRGMHASLFADSPARQIQATRREDLAACLAALRAQGDAEWEWLIGLPDAAGDLPAELARAPGVRVLQGAGTAPLTFNALLAAATGETVALLDPSGRPTRDAVAMIRAAFATHADCMLAYTDEEMLDEGGAPRDGVFKPAF
ncbi:MAG: hypothetical protein B7Y61_24820, partial [Rhizobiales bacterium 35-66-30]